MNRTPHSGRLIRAAVLVTLAICVAQCSVTDQHAPALTGPSERGRSLTMFASPDQLPRDGASQSVITILARDAVGGPIEGLWLNLEAAPVSAISGASVQTNGEGKAFVAVTAPEPSSLGNEVVVTATPLGDNWGNGSTRSVTVRILGPENTTVPEPKFTTSPDSPTFADVITFDASLTEDEGALCGAACTYAWAFGDGTTGTGEVVTHQYGSPGFYTVTLTVTDNAGTSASLTKQLFVDAVAAPTVSFTQTPSSPLVGQKASFKATTTKAKNHVITSYAWEWGDGTSSQTSSETITHTFSAVGTVVVTLTVTDDLGQTATASQQVDVSSGITVDFTFSPSEPKTTTASVLFDASGTTSLLGSIVSYAWNYGDGSAIDTKTASSTAHAYPVAGSYTVTLTVTNSAGSTGTLSKTLTVTTP